MPREMTLASLKGSRFSSANTSSPTRTSATCSPSISAQAPPQSSNWSSEQMKCRLAGVLMPSPFRGAPPFGCRGGPALSPLVHQHHIGVQSLAVDEMAGPLQRRRIFHGLLPFALVGVDDQCHRRFQLRADTQLVVAHHGAKIVE